MKQQHHHHHRRHHHHYQDLKAMSLNVLLIVVISLVPLVLTDSKDLRFISYAAFHLGNSSKLFHHNDIDNYQQLLFDNNNNRIIVGARDHLVTFHIDSFEKLQVIPWLASNERVVTCRMTGLSESDCHNFIKVLFIHGENLYVCGTYAGHPVCQTRLLSNLDLIPEQQSQSALCPFRPNGNNSYILSRDTGSLYTGLSMGHHGREHLIVKALPPYSVLIRTKKSSRCLDDPQFVAMFDVDSYIYIFFREVAVEHIPWGKLIVSRVARICKGDSGNREKAFQSFIKTRLNCSRPGEYPFYYDELQSIHYDQERKVFIGAFTTSPNAIPGSAVCQFHLDDIDLSLRNKVKVYNPSCNCWTVENNERPSCTPDNFNFTGTSLHELIDLAAQPTQLTPLIEAPMERFTHIVAMQTAVRFKGKKTSVNLLYVSTLEGHIKRYLILPGQTLTSCLIETIELLPPNTGQLIKFLTFNPVTGLLIVGTTERVYQVSKERCHRFNTKTLCESVQDPFCEWSSTEQVCIHSDLPSINSCPVVENLKRTWYGWSDWSKCSVTCGDGIQMRMLVCLDDLGRLSTNSDLRNALRCSGDNYVIRPCKLKSCEDTSVSTWSTWMSNDPPASTEVPEEDKKKSRKEKRFRCLCAQDGVNRCSATLQVSERSCKVKGECSSRLKRLTEKENHNYNHHQTLRKCTKELVMKKEENTKMKKQLHEMINYKHHHHHHHHHTTHPITTAVTTVITTPTTTIKDSSLAARFLVKSFNPHYDVSRINLNHKLEQQQQQNVVKDNTNYNSNRLPEYGAHEGFRRADLSVHKPRSVENRLKNPHENIRYHHFSLPENIFYHRQRSTAMTTTMTTPAPKCPTIGPNVLPVNYGIFYGYCGCRDLGSFRVCHRCNHI